MCTFLENRMKGMRAGSQWDLIVHMMQKHALLDQRSEKIMIGLMVTSQRLHVHAIWIRTVFI